MRKFWIFCAILGCNGPARANDGVTIGVGGRWRFLKGEHRQIRMVSERVAMTIGPKEGADFVADFVFKNEGPKTRVVMGFPERSQGSLDEWVKKYRRQSAFSGFTSWVDGRKTPVKRVLNSAASGAYSALWIKTVSFGARQMRRVRVKYHTPGGEGGDGLTFQNYDFTGGNWKGKVTETLLDVRFLASGAWEINNYSQNTPTLRRRGNEFHYRWRNWQAEDDFYFSYRSTLPGALDRDRDEVPLRLENPQKGQPGVVLEANSEPPAVQEGKKLWVLVDWLCEPLAVKQTPQATEITDQIDRAWDKKTNILTLTHDARQVKIPLAAALANSYASPHRAGTPFYVRQFGELSLYVPAEALKPLHVAFGIDAKKHTISKRGLK